MKNWYIVQSHSSFENKVASLIKEEADKAKISEKFEEIIVPTHDVTEVKRGKRIQRKKKYFPGYVLIKSEMDNNIYHMIKGIKRVSGFLGSKGIPVPVSDKEVEKILGQIKDGVAQPKSGIDYSVGEKVQEGRATCRPRIDCGRAARWFGRDCSGGLDVIFFDATGVCRYRADSRCGSDTKVASHTAGDVLHRADATGRRSARCAAGDAR